MFVRLFFLPQDDPFKSKTHLFNSSNNQDLYSDPFQTEDPFTSDPFKGADPFKSSKCIIVFWRVMDFAFWKKNLMGQIHWYNAIITFNSSDPFGDDPFKESDPFHAHSTDDPFQKTSKSDPFSADPFTKNSVHSMTLPLKVRKSQTDGLNSFLKIIFISCVDSAFVMLTRILSMVTNRSHSNSHF